MKIRPILDKVLVKRQAPETVTAGGIHIPTARVKKNQIACGTGEVVAVGPGKVLKNGSVAPMDVAPGDVVYFNVDQCRPLRDRETGEEIFVVLREEEILGKIERGE